MSEICCEDLINKLLSSSSIAVLENEWPSIFTFLERKENIHYLPQLSEAVFGTVFDKIGSFAIEDKVLGRVLPFFQKIFFSSILYIPNLVKKQDNSDNKQDKQVSIEVYQLLKVCLNVLGGYSLLIDNLVKLGSINLQYVKSLLKTLPCVLLTSFSHCQESENVYGIYFSSSADYLTALFRKSYEISNQFNKWIDEYITFNFQTEDDTDILIKALDTLYSVGEIVVRLDVKTMVEQWKGLIKITSKYACFLKDRLDISHPIKFLSSSLQDTVMETMALQKETDEKFRIRNLKLASFVLKVILKLCEVYKGFLNGCEACLMDLLILLNRCSRLGRNNNIVEIDRFVVVGAAPLLSHLLEDRPFLERFSKLSLNLESLSSDEAIGFLFTHLRLLKFLISTTNEEIKESWLKIPLISNIMTLFSMSYSMLDLNTKIEDNDAYTYLVSTTAAFMISCFSPDNFFESEKILIEHLISCNIEIGILVSDLLCLLGRLTNEEVCLKETKFICQILCNTDWSGIQRPEACVAGLTAGRLFHLLSKNGKEIIEKQFQPQTHPHLWLFLNYELVKSHSLISDLLLFKEPLDVSSLHYFHMIESIALCSSINDEEFNNKLSYTIEQLWNGFETFHKFEDRQPDWWYYIFFLFSKCISSRNEKMDSFVNKKVLNDLIKFTALKQSSINYYICVIMKNLTHLTFKNVSTASDIFINCISSDNFLIKQIAIECFFHFADTNNHDSIVRNVSSDPSIEYYISDYYKKIPLCKTNFMVNVPNAFVHKCFVYDDDIHPNKKFKQNSENQEIRHLLLNFVECVNLIKEFTKQRYLTPEEREIINIAICDLEKL